MQIFDRIDPLNLDQREWQLLLLAMIAIFVLTVGAALLMYPAVFSGQVLLSGNTQGRAFFGFCALSTFLLGYLMDRQVTIIRLRKQLAEEQKTIIQLRHQVSADLLSALPDFSHFRDRLAMEYRRAATTQHPLSLLVIVLKSAQSPSNPLEVSTAFGDAAKALTLKLRGEDSIYLFSPGVFCVVLPDVVAYNAYLVANRLTKGLGDASGATHRFSVDVRVFNYPEHAKNAHEIEEAVRPFVPRQTPLPSGVEASAVPTEAR